MRFFPSSFLPLHKVPDCHSSDESFYSRELSRNLSSAKNSRNLPRCVLLYFYSLILFVHRSDIGFLGLYVDPGLLLLTASPLGTPSCLWKSLYWAMVSRAQGRKAMFQAVLRVFRYLQSRFVVNFQKEIRRENAIMSLLGDKEACHVIYFKER